MFWNGWDYIKENNKSTLYGEKNIVNQKNLKMLLDKEKNYPDFSRKLHQITKNHLEKIANDTYFLLHIANMTKLMISDGNHSASGELSDTNHRVNVF